MSTTPQQQPLGQLFDPDQALRFLELLGKDPATTYFRLLGCGPNKPGAGRDRRGFNPAELEAANRQTRCLYVVIGNSTTASGNAGGVVDADIAAVPAFFVEWDEGPIDWQLNAWRELQLPEPTLMVSTGGKSIHAYWVLEHPLEPQQWRSITKRLIAHCGSDPQCCNPSRVMRLPGGAYRDKKKGDLTGNRAEIVEQSGRRYALKDLLQCLPPELPPPSRAAAPPSSTVVPFPRRDDLPPRSVEAIEAAAAFIPERVVGCNTYEVCRRGLCGCAAALEETGMDPAAADEAALDLLATKWPDRGTAQQALESSSTRNAAAFWAIAREGGYNLSRNDLVKNHRIGRAKVADAQQHPLNPEEATTLDELLGQAEEGKLRRVRNDRLSQAVALLMPLRYNLLTNRIERNGEPIHGDYLSGLYLELAEQHQLDVAKERVIDAAIRVARQQAYHPVQEYLNGITDQLSPEDWAAIDVRCFGIQDPSGWSVIHLQRQLIGLVARALSPGCELHTCLVLQSDGQGIGKSTFWKILGGQWFSDSLGDLRDLREDRLQLHSAWIHEWGEIDNVIGKRESETLKRFITTSRDDVRKPYGRGTEQLLRSCGLVGTTNRRDFIKDPTGNRRFPIIPINHVDLEWIQQNRDRIWGSALAAYKAGHRWHYEGSEAQAVSEQARAFAAVDPLRDALETWTDDNPDAEVPLVRILWDLQRQEHDAYWLRRKDKAFMKQVALAMTSLGWVTVQAPRARYQLPNRDWTDKVSLWKRPSAPTILECSTPPQMSHLEDEECRISNPSDVEASAPKVDAARQELDALADAAWSMWESPDPVVMSPRETLQAISDREGCLDVHAEEPEI